MSGVVTLAGRVAWRELRLEAAGHEASTAVPPFVAAAVLLAGLAFGPRPQVLRAVAPGLAWLVVLFAAVPLARPLAAAERDDGCWDLLRGLVPAAALFFGKVAGLWLWLVLAWALATGLVVAVFGVALPAVTVLAGMLGTLGLSAVTVIFGTLLASSDRGSGLLAVLLLPVALPALLAGTQASVAGQPAGPWLGLLVAYDLIALAVGWASYPVLLEE